MRKIIVFLLSAFVFVGSVGTVDVAFADSDTSKRRQELNNKKAQEKGSSQAQKKSTKSGAKKESGNKK